MRLGGLLEDLFSCSIEFVLFMNPNPMLVESPSKFWTVRLNEWFVAAKELYCH
jgi:hypothetical protein